MSKSFQICPGAVKEMADAILREYPEHEPLVKCALKVDLVFAFGERPGQALRLHGKSALGIARIIRLKDRVMGRGDVEVSLDYAWWQEATEAERRALLDHELYHFKVHLDHGGRWPVDDIGRPVVKMREHDFDFGWFKLIAERHGLNSQECQQAQQLMERAGKVLFQPELAFASGHGGQAADSRFASLEIEASTVGNVVITPASAETLIKACDSILGKADVKLDEDENLIQQCIEVIRSEQNASVSLLQRRLRLGYIRAARIMDELESRGIVGPAKGAEPRDILTTV